MKRGVLIGLILILPVLVSAERSSEGYVSIEETLKTFLSPLSYRSESLKSFESFLTKLDKKHAAFKDDRDFIRYAFAKTHHRFLKDYAAYATLDETFDNGSYNCLTGTILLSLILRHYGFEHEVIETNYHIFIVAQTSRGSVLLESTDPLNGFVSSAADIETRIALYKQNQILDQQANKSYYKFKFELYNSVSLEELRGLTYYNKAVDSFNQKNLQAAVQHLVKANELYASHRIDEFSQILLLSLQQSELDLKTKENYMNTVLSLRQKSMPLILASN